ncbi:50S ribosomal protein L32 [Paraburkholderia fungorum]|uniref:50S ribosomal protein L32 n=1 Tax=Paraburkholderia fungorum TaxID=134537 RepID=UPI0038BDFF8C
MTANPQFTPRKIKRDGREYKRRYQSIVELYKPSIVDCSTCGSPRHRSYVCVYCGKE